jgi:hypothetical protein
VSSKKDGYDSYATEAKYEDAYGSKKDAHAAKYGRKLSGFGKKKAEKKEDKKVRQTRHPQP